MENTIIFKRRSLTENETKTNPKLGSMPLFLPEQMSLEPLNLTKDLELASQEIIARIPALEHIDLSRVLFTLFRSRPASRTYTYARCYPLSQKPLRRGARTYKLSPILMPGRKHARYILAFAWPRFWQLGPRERLETLVHELYHISPKFDGEARAFETGGWHGAGLDWYDQVIHELSERHLPPAMQNRYPSLSKNLRAREITGRRLRLPRWEWIPRS